MNVDMGPIAVILLPSVSILKVHIRRIFKFLERAPAAQHQIFIEKRVSYSQFEIPNECNCKKGYLAYYTSSVGSQNDPIETNYGPILTTDMPDMVCRDVDECSDGTHGCHEHATCYNKNGLYQCRCNS